MDTIPGNERTDRKTTKRKMRILGKNNISPFVEGKT
jgi:hypothetical protein